MRAVILTLMLTAACGRAPPPRVDDDTCCQCLVAIDCLVGQPGEDQCLAHIGDPTWRSVAIIPQYPACMTDNDGCGSWCQGRIEHGP